MRPRWFGNRIGDGCADSQSDKLLLSLVLLLLLLLLLLLRLSAPCGNRSFSLSRTELIESRLKLLI